MTIKAATTAFANRTKGSCHNAATDGQRYYLHGSIIARRRTCGVEFHWCSWYTPTTVKHMNKLLEALGSDLRVSYAEARDNAATSFYVEVV